MSMSAPKVPKPPKPPPPPPSFGDIGAQNYGAFLRVAKLQGLKATSVAGKEIAAGRMAGPVTAKQSLRGM